MESFFAQISVVVVCTAVLSIIGLLLKQPIIVIYLLCGMIAGPAALGWVDDVEFVHDLSQIGVTLLLFLAGVVLHPNRLLRLFRESLLVTIATSLTSFFVGFGFCLLWGFPTGQCLVAGAALMFSSTILVIKLLPTTELHQRRMGSICIAILIVEDLIAVGVIMFLSGSANGGWTQVILLPLKAILLILFAGLFEQFILRPLMARIDRFHETLYLASLGWCLGLSLVAEHIGFSHEVGAFIAGVALARSPISTFISEGLKPFRDFFLVLFFFALGAQLNWPMVKSSALPAALLATLIMGIKPLVRYQMFKLAGEKNDFAKESSIRLGQASEFTLIIATIAEQTGHLTVELSTLIKLTAIFTLVVSSYLVVFLYPTPLGTWRRLKRD